MNGQKKKDRKINNGLYRTLINEQHEPTKTVLNTNASEGYVVPAPLVVPC